jgi:hypothetical protein
MAAAESPSKFLRTIGLCGTASDWEEDECRLGKENRSLLLPQKLMRFRPVVDAFAHYPDVTSGKLMSSYGLKRRNLRHVRTKAIRREASEQSRGCACERRCSKTLRPGHGRLMKEWLVAADGGPDWLELAKEAYNFVKRRAS